MAGDTQSKTNQVSCNLREALLTDIFTFIVGHDRTPMRIHRGIVARVSEPLNALMNNSAFEDSDGKQASLKHVDEKVFQAFLEFAYTECYDSQYLCDNCALKEYTKRPAESFREENVKTEYPYLSSDDSDCESSRASELDNGSSDHASKAHPELLTMHAKVHIFAREKCIFKLANHSLKALEEELITMKRDRVISITQLSQLINLLEFLYGLQYSEFHSVPVYSDSTEVLIEDSTILEALKGNQSTGGESRTRMGQETNDNDIRTQSSWELDLAKCFGLRDLVIRDVGKLLPDLMKEDEFRAFFKANREIAGDVLLWQNDVPLGYRI